MGGKDAWKNFTTDPSSPSLSICIISEQFPADKNTGIIVSLATYAPGPAGSSQEEIGVSTETGTTTLPVTNTSTQMGTLTSTPTPTASPTVTISPAGTNTAIVSACNQAEFVSDVNYPDSSTIYVGTGFDKTWRLRNIGSCTGRLIKRMSSIQGTE